MQASRLESENQRKEKEQEVSGKQKDEPKTFVWKNAVDSLLSTSSNNNLIKINFLVKDDFLITEIEDNGIGIDKNTIEQLNNKQYYSTKENGSGLGINICKRIVSDHNGEYSIQNSTTGGCIVRVSLPINKKS